MNALSIETLTLTKRFGAFTALEDVSIRIPAGTVHALLGENGAGKSTLVKALVGFHRASSGSVLVNGRETDIPSPQMARSLGIGMVYQHFTLVPSMTVAENLALAGGAMPAVIRWPETLRSMQAFMAQTPFALDLEARVADLSAGEKQKTEIVKQLYARNRFLILDEPTSVLTPEEADEVLGAVREMAHRGDITVLMITHKFREVTQFADDVSVLRRGRLSGSARVGEVSQATLEHWMIGEAKRVDVPPRTRFVPAPGAAVPLALGIEHLMVTGDNGLPAVRDVSLQVHAGEIVGIAGVSGNGQRELIEMLSGQRDPGPGTITIFGQAFQGSRRFFERHNIAALPEEPLRNGCVAALSVAGNLALREYDHAPLSTAGWMHPNAMRSLADQRIGEYQVKTRGPDQPIAELSGGNVQRAVLARELSRQAKLLIVMNPVFGLDFAAVGDIHRRLIEERNRGCAVLLVGEDLDELLELSDRVLVMHDGKIVFESADPPADRAAIGRAMGGHHEPHLEAA